MKSSNNIDAKKIAVLNRTGVAARFEVNLSTVDDWRRRGCPAKKVGREWRFVEADVAAWRATQRQPAEVDSDKPVATLADARRRKALADAELAEYALAEKKRDVVPISEAVDLLTLRFSRVRTRLLAIPTALAPVIITAKDKVEAKEQLTQAITEALEKLSAPPSFPGAAP